jgi:hypothetical protein
MANAALRRLWAAVRRDFDRAWVLLPSPPAEVEGRVARLAEWLDHNELELALDELEALGEDNAALPAYWEQLRSAAERMGLATHVARLSRRIALCTCGVPSDLTALLPAWRTDTVVSLAHQMTESCDFSAMPILADALQDAGCDNADILSHCRGPGPHVRGCWVVDLVLGKE